MYTKIPNKEAESSLPLKSLEAPTTGKNTLILILALLVVTFGTLSTLSFYFFPNTADRLSALLVTLFGREERIELIADKQNVFTKEVFTISYEHIGREETGSYVLTYPCSINTNLSFATLNGASTETSTLTCDEKIAIAPKAGEKSGSVSLTSVTSSHAISEVPITIAFLPEGTTTPLVKGTVFMVIENKNPLATTPSITPTTQTPSTSTTPIKKPTNQPSGKPTNTTPAQNTTVTSPISTSTHKVTADTPTYSYYGRADLAVRIIETGTVDKITGAFTATSSFRSSDRIGIKFEVRNDGGREVNSWYFNAVLPSFPAHIFTSPGQSPLIPGARIEFTLGFDNVNMSTGAVREFVVNADPAGSIGEANEINNIAKIIIANVTP